MASISDFPTEALAQVQLEVLAPESEEDEGTGGLELALTHIRSVALLDGAKASSRCDLWAKTWSTSLLLAQSLRARRVRACLTGRRTLEIGAGALGLPSLLAASAGATVLCTDGIAEAIGLLAHNAERNQLGGLFEAARLSWFDAGAPERAAAASCDVVLGSDVLFASANVRPLAALIAAALAHAENGVLILTDPARPSAEGFAEALEAHGFTVEMDSVSRAAIFEGVLRQADLYVACCNPRVLQRTSAKAGDREPGEEQARQLVDAVRSAWAALPTRGGGGGMGERFDYVVDLNAKVAPPPLPSFIESNFPTRAEYLAWRARAVSG